jgi:hypothetical protein
VPKLSQTINSTVASLVTANPKFKPDAEREDFKKFLPLWRGYLDLYELDEQKLGAIVEPHGSDEPKEKLELRRKEAAVYNLVPMIVDMIGGYVFAERPKIDVDDDPDLTGFLADCDGNDTEWIDFVRVSALPMSLVMGFLDVLVENPSVAAPQVKTQADVEALGITPHVTPMLPLQRINWSCAPNGAYQWVTYRDIGADNPNPLANDPTAPAAYVRFARGVEETGNKAFFVRSWKEIDQNGNVSQDWTIDGDLLPMERTPVTTLYHRRSNDPERRHFGISKIAMIALLTKRIVQILSWTTEDVLANLAIFAFPTRDGQPPKGKDGDAAIQKIDAFTMFFYTAASGSPPVVVQGDVSHIEIKMKLVEAHIREILRLANLLAASGSGAGGEASNTGGKSQSGRQAEIERSELYRELRDTADGLDQFTLQVLALVKSWKTNSDIDIDQLTEGDKVSVDFFKGPYSLDPLENVIANAQSVIDMFSSVSPTTVESAYSQLARQFLNASGKTLDEALKEIAENTGRTIDDNEAHAQLMKDAEAAAAKAAIDNGGTPPVEDAAAA